ncbi:hypothetical protein A9G48_00380 [Gilliamella sp. wkB18]|jgi:hypothetical protein|uniref:hypothetical protein n=1 Tax=Gilliamella sp. wkB18 TaxID=3120260 RepID=UPI000551C237|nr:hypothetical protein [Gilliamella apicola]OCG64606.1 hypothetical protein A9G48_00380 [Gilliamella apicola]
MISNFKIDTSEKNVSWYNNGLIVCKSFEKKIFQAVEITFLSQILIIADYREKGKNNMFIYDKKGDCISNPSMPSPEFYGIYSIWYLEGNMLQTVILLSNDNSNYEKKCIFNLENHNFSEFSLTK